MTRTIDDDNVDGAAAYDFAEACHSLLGSGVPSAHVAQIRRVLVHTAGAAHPPVAPSTIVAAFRRHRLISASLTDACGETSGPWRSAEALAMAFAGALYPQRVFQLDRVELAQRLARFREFHATATRSGATAAEATVQIARDVVAGPLGLAADDAMRLLDDLAAVEFVGKAVPERPDGDRAERRMGAALYLSTCGTRMLARTFEGWRREAALVRFLCRNLPSPPSELYPAADRSPRPHWPTVRARLQRLFPGVEAEVLDATVVLEITVWGRVAQFLPGGMLRDAVGKFWEHVWTMLISGFPYFAFRSRFVWWWKQCLVTFDFEASRWTTLDEDPPGDEPGAAMPLTLEPELLFAYREGYRFIRTTFFRREYQRPATGDGRARGHTCEAAEAAAGAHEQLRRAVDDLWHRRVCQTLEHGRSAGESVATVASAHCLSVATVDMLYKRLRRRLWIYSLARVDRWTNEEIRQATPPSGYAHAATAAHPLEDETVLATIASLARSVPLGQTLLWMFAAHLFVSRHHGRPLHRRDPWGPERFVRELTVWTDDETFWRVATGEQGHASRLGLEAIAGVRGATDSAGVAAEAERLGRRIGDDRLHTWRRALDACGEHWMAPAWVLAVIEDLSPDTVLRRLRPDRDEREAVRALVRRLREPDAVG